MQKQLSWKRSNLNGVYFSACGKYAVKSDGTFGWYTYANDGSDDWDLHSVGWDMSFKNAKKFAEYLNEKAVA